jgi:hypothetical protein
MDFFGTWNAGSSLSVGLGYLLQGKLGQRVNSLHGFANKIGNKLSPSRAIGNQMGKVNLHQKLTQRADPLMAYDWIAMVLPRKISTDSTIPWWYIDSITLPELSMAEYARNVNGKDVHYAGRPSISEVSIKVYADITGDTFYNIQGWARSTYRQDKYFALPVDYKRDIQVYVYDHHRLVVTDFLIRGCWISTNNNPDLGTDPTPLVHELNLNCDEVYVNYDSDLSSIKQNIQGFADSLTTASFDKLPKLF